VSEKGDDGEKVGEKGEGEFQKGGRECFAFSTLMERKNSDADDDWFFHARLISIEDGWKQDPGLFLRLCKTAQCCCHFISVFLLFLLESLRLSEKMFFYTT